ncbi:hypothetical protein FQN60_006145 [Etheostoma spectabile]|uniref:Uncharacterized protein n=1 Tax=Etheostoma spectabile TaxID=54343 RepID=A0A5J5CLB0_9PERO|nr:hypothetical protein FQN60_006145 [Etheostoma spectabile]
MKYYVDPLTCTSSPPTRALVVVSTLPLSFLVPLNAMGSLWGLKAAGDEALADRGISFSHHKTPLPFYTSALAEEELGDDSSERGITRLSRSTSWSLWRDWSRHPPQDLSHSGATSMAPMWV